MSHYEKLNTEWDGLAEVRALLMDRTISPEETAWSTGIKDLENYFPLAVRSIGQLALHAGDEKTRLNAAKSIVAANIQLKRLQAEQAGGPLAEFAANWENEIKRMQAETGIAEGSLQRED